MTPATPSNATFYPGNLPYARPALMRPPSPAGSINTEYGPDETDTQDLAMSDEEFERKILAELKIDQPSDAEAQADVMPIRFPYFQPGSHEERGAGYTLKILLCKANLTGSSLSTYAIYAREAGPGARRERACRRNYDARVTSAGGHSGVL